MTTSAKVNLYLVRVFHQQFDKQTETIPVLFERKSKHKYAIIPGIELATCGVCNNAPGTFETFEIAVTVPDDLERALLEFTDI